ncbi:non-ltr retroelement reverse transcriptase [Gossypium australe]|uniref:Non-ltr retroelement reverse transcriptase n=1 Tax=Gossypium australe TaxID=47621 RepID=A0A5B6W2E5_9ROSI|nr:non-ltr retroelement reverse transcriptase [Gossypium australe]
MEMVRLKLGFSCGIDIGAVGSKGGLSLGWKGNSLVLLRSYSSFHIDDDITDCDYGVTWRLIGFYGNLMESLRSISWDLLCHIHSNNLGPWLVVGDFNEITISLEKRGGRLRSENQMAKFQNALKACGLVDLGFSGIWFTWERGRFQATNIHHCPILIDTIGKSLSRENFGGHRFKFEASWYLDQSFGESGPCDNAVVKLAKAAQFFRLWNRSRSQELKRQRMRLEERLTYLQAQDPNDDILEEIMEVQLGLNLEADKDEIFWQQRARVNWLKHGDKNTSFFYRTALSHHYRNRIVGFKNEEGGWVSN